MDPIGAVIWIIVGAGAASFPWLFCYSRIEKQSDKFRILSQQTFERLARERADHHETIARINDVIVRLGDNPQIEHQLKVIFTPQEWADYRKTKSFYNQRLS